MGWSNSGWESDQGGWYKNAVVASGVTLDPGFVNTNITLSNGNLTATATSTSDNTVRSSVSHSTGKFYCEFTPGSVGNVIWGACGASQPVNNYIGQTNNSFGLQGGGSWIGGTGAASGPTQVTGHVYAMCTDITNGSLWIKDLTAGGNWNNDGTADPTTNTGGRVFSSNAATGGCYAAFMNSNNGDSITLNFGSSAYTGTRPTGYSNW